MKFSPGDLVCGKKTLAVWRVVEYVPAGKETRHRPEVVVEFVRSLVPHLHWLPGTKRRVAERDIRPPPDMIVFALAADGIL